MKCIIIPDVHGTEHWKKTKELIDSVDKVIFLGDYFDHPTIGFNRQISNARQIIYYKNKFPEKICLCWGNHDTSYYLGDECSGFQVANYEEIKWFFKKHESLFNVVYVYDNWIFSHAGVSKLWMNIANVADLSGINTLFKNDKKYFFWQGYDNYGDDPRESPLWIRPASLQDVAVDNYNQVIGHTKEINGILTEKLHKNNGKLVLIDSPKHKNIIMLDTMTGEYGLI